MIYALIYLYIVPCFLFYTECMDDEETRQGLQWVPPTFFWPILIPVYLLARIFGK